jgi:hypothetical protein
MHLCWHHIRNSNLPFDANLFAGKLKFKVFVAVLGRPPTSIGRWWWIRVGLKKERINQSSNPYLFKQQQTPEEEKIWLVFLQHFRLYTSMALLSKNIFLQTSKTTLSSSELYLKYHLDQRLIHSVSKKPLFNADDVAWKKANTTILDEIKRDFYSDSTGEVEDMHKYELTDFDGFIHNN